MTPRALLLDLDDTVVEEHAAGRDLWAECLPPLAAQLGAGAHRFAETLAACRRHFWSDPERHRRGRLDMAGTRRFLVAEALRTLGAAEDAAALAAGRAYADAVSEARERLMRPFPGALETLAALRARGMRLALVTNGGAEAQRRKIERFRLAPLFDALLVEGELGYGKPDPRIFARALAAVGTDAGGAWMVGNDLEYDVAGAAAVGIHAVWIDHGGTGPPPEARVRPDRVLRSLAELAELL